MTTQPKKKLCWHCEGRVTLQDDNCPYCGVSLAPLAIGNRGNDSLFAPPYKAEVTQEIHTIPSSPYSIEEQTQTVVTAIEREPQPLSPISEETLQAFLLPLILFSLGMILLLFSFVLALFSNHGVLTLQWNANYWLFYLLTGLPLIGCGWLTLKK